MARSGMDYSKMSQLIDKVEGTYASEIHSILTGDVEKIVARIRDAYSGEAADEYKKKFSETADTVDITMASIIKKMKDNFVAEKSAYEEQEKKMKESLMTGEPVNTQGN